MSSGEPRIDSVLLIGFGGPESPEEILPFLRKVAEGRNISDERLRDVEKHYLHVGGRSPYNDWTERQRKSLESWLEGHGHPVPVYAGMRNWHPLLADVIARMQEDGKRCPLGIILSVHQSDVGWDRYRQDVAEAGGHALSVRYLDPWFDHPRFLEACAQRLEENTGYLRGRWPAHVPVIFTAHSIPAGMAADSPYVQQLRGSCEGVAALLELPDWELAYQSRSGPPHQPWLEPDVNDALRARASQGMKEVALQAVGFLCDHVEVLYDLDVEARDTCGELGVTFHRAGCVNDHPEFVAMLGELTLGHLTA
jgi:ferrochelatase